MIIERAQEANVYTQMGAQEGMRMSSAGNAGMASHGNKPNVAKKILVKIRTVATPPTERMKFWACSIRLSSVDMPSIFKAR